MKGIIESVFRHPVNNGVNSINIAGDDGVVYFGHRNDFAKKCKHYRKGREVTFEAVNEGRTHLRAVSIDVEVPARPEKEDVLVSVTHLADGAYVKRIIKSSGTRVCLIVKDGRLVISCLPEFEKDMIWMYQRGGSGVNEGAWKSAEKD